MLKVKVELKGYVQTIHDFNVELISKGSLFGQQLEERRYVLNPHNKSVKFYLGIDSFHLDLTVGIEERNNKTVIFAKGEAKALVVGTPIDAVFLTV